MKGATSLFGFCITCGCIALALTSCVGSRSAQPDLATLSATTGFLSPISPLYVTPVTQQACKPAEEQYGAVRGTAVLIDGRSAQNAVLYLAEFKDGDSGVPLVSLDIARAPQAVVAADGSFCFASVPPGKYALVAWEAVHSTLVADPATGFTLEVVVQPGSVIDLPTITVP